MTEVRNGAHLRQILPNAIPRAKGKWLHGGFLVVGVFGRKRIVFEPSFRNEFLGVFEVGFGVVGWILRDLDGCAFGDEDAADDFAAGGDAAFEAYMNGDECQSVLVRG